MKKKLTYNQLADYIQQLELQVDNQQRAIYDVSSLLQEYVTMRKDVGKLQKHLQKRLGSTSQIPTRWSVFLKYCKTSYLELKKKLASYL